MKKPSKTSALNEYRAIAKRGGVCEHCGKVVPVLTVDHIIPVQIIEALDYTGEAVYEDVENFQYLCSPCNMLKTNLLDLSNTRTKGLLLKYIQNIP